jgi:hypothetical protein
MEKIWSKIRMANEASWPMGSCCGRLNVNPDSRYLSERGLIRGRYYIIIDAIELGENKLIQLKNPFKSPITWKGDWSWNSKKWTDEMRELFENEIKLGKIKNAQTDFNLPNATTSLLDQDIFWMPFNDFTRYFHSVDICKLRFGWLEKRMTSSFNLNTNFNEYKANSNEIKVYRLILFEKTNVDLSLFNCKSSNKNVTYDPDLFILVFRTSEEVSRETIGNLVYSSKHILKGYLSEDYVFEAGEYFLLPISFNSWFNHSTNNVIAYEDFPIKEQFYNKFNLVIHSEKDFFMDEEQHSHSFLADAIIQFCIKMGNKEDIGLENARIYTLTKGFEGYFLCLL